MTDDLYYRKLESTSTTDLVDMIREKDERIEETEKENAEMKEKIAQYDELSSELIGDGLGYIGLIKQAKEIIKEFFRITTVIDDDFEPDYSQLIEKAEAFIKEVENERKI